MTQATTASKYIVKPDDGISVRIRDLGIRFMLQDTSEHVSVVEHPLGPHSLGSPMHTHTREDEYSFVIEGEFGVRIGGETFTAGPGTLIIKPKDVPHAFWNATDRPARILEIISPAGFDHFFEEIAAAWPDRNPTEEQVAAAAGIAERYGLLLDLASVPQLCEELGLNP